MYSTYSACSVPVTHGVRSIQTQLESGRPRLGQTHAVATRHQDIPPSWNPRVERAWCWETWGHCCEPGCGFADSHSLTELCVPLLRRCVRAGRREICCLCWSNMVPPAWPVRGEAPHPARPCSTVRLEVTELEAVRK